MDSFEDEFVYAEVDEFIYKEFFNPLSSDDNYDDDELMIRMSISKNGERKEHVLNFFRWDNCCPKYDKWWSWRSLCRLL